MISPVQANNLVAAAAMANQLENSGTIHMHTRTNPQGSGIASAEMTSNLAVPLLQNSGILNMPMVTQSTPTNLASHNTDRVRGSQNDTFQNQRLNKSPLLTE